MNIIILLCKHPLSLYAIKALTAIKHDVSLNHTDFVCIVSKKNEDADLFERSHEAPLDVNDNGLIKFNYPAIKQIVQEEIDAHPNASLYILGIDEIDLLNVGQLRRELQLYGLTDLELLPFRDKNEMKKYLHKNTLPFPKSELFFSATFIKNERDYYQKIVSTIGSPFILKPTQSAASVGIKKIITEKDFLGFMVDYQTHPQYMIEEFIEGTQYHCESIIQNGEFIFEACAQYIYPPIEMILNNHLLGSFPLDPGSPKFKEIIAFNRKALSALGKPNVTSTLELYEHPTKGFIFIELNGRLPGEPMNYVYYKQFGIWMSTLDFKLQTDQPLSAVSLHTQTNTCWIYIPLKKGTITKLNTPSLNSKCTLKWHVQKGATILSSMSVNEKAATLFLENEDKEELLEDILALKAFNFIEVA